MIKRIIDISTEKTLPLKHYWSNCVGAGRACEGLRAQWQKQLRQAVQDCGFRYIRFHGLFCDEMGLYHEKNGTCFLHFTYIDQLFDSLLEIGIRPFVEFGFMPEKMASGTQTQFWWKGNVTPPQDYGEWGRLIESLLRHWIDRYGIEEVSRWYFEVWNEADLNVFFSGTKSEYFRLYETTARTVKSVSPLLRVGGPATSNFVPDGRFDGEREDLTKHITHLTKDLQSLSWKGVWLEDFLHFCEENKLPLDFLSTHPYPTDFALDGQDAPEGKGVLRGRSRYVDSTRDDLLWIKKMLKNSPYNGIEVHLTEWSSSPTSRDYSHDYLPPAAYIIKTNIDCIGLADSLSYWVFTDIFEEEGPGPEAFHGGFGLMNLHGIKKPAYHAYTFLNRLGNTLLCRGENYCVTENTDRKLRAVFWNYPSEMISAVPIASYPDHEKAKAIQNTGSSLCLDLTLTGLKPNADFILETVDQEHGCAVSCWEKLGCPESLDKDSFRKISRSADLILKRTFFSDSHGTLKLTLDMSPWSIHSLSQN